MKNILIAIFMLLVYNTLSAQKTDCTINLQVRVIDSISGLGINTADLEINDEVTTHYSDSNGVILVKNVCRGLNTLHISYSDGKHFHFKIILVRDTSMEVKLNHKIHLIDPAIIFASKNHNSIDPSKEMVKTSNSNFSDMAAQIIGINVMKTGNNVSKPIVNGLQNNRILILNNGVRQEGQQWGSDHAPEIDAFAFNSIKLLKGADALRYGSDAIGGVIMAELPTLTNKGASTQSSLTSGFNSNGNGFMTSASISGHFLLPIRIQLTAKVAGNKKTPDYFLDNTGNQETDFSAHTGFKFTKSTFKIYYSVFSSKIGIFSGSHLGNLTDLNLAIKRGEPIKQPEFTYRIEKPYQTVIHSIGKVESKSKLSSHKFIFTSLAVQKNKRSEFDIHRSTKLGPSVAFDLITQTAEILVENTSFKGGNLKFSMNNLLQKNSYGGHFFIPNFTQLWLGSFLSFQKSIQHFNFETAIRADYRNIKTAYPQYDTTGYGNLNYKGLTGVLGFKYDHHGTWQSGWISSSSFRPPGVNELYANGVHHGAASFEIGNLRLRPERSFKNEFWIKIPFKNKLTIYTNAHFNYVKDFVSLAPTFPPILTIRGAFPTFIYRQGNAIIKGVDLNLDYNLSKALKFNLMASYIYGKSIDSLKWVPYMPPPSISLNLSYSKNHWMLFAQYNFVSDQKHYLKESDYAPPPPSYFLFSTGCVKNKLLKIKNLSASLSIQNILNTKYRNYLNTFRYFASETGRDISIKFIYKTN